METTFQINGNDEKINSKNDENGADFKEYIDILDATMIKRAAEGKFYGVAVIGEGLVDLLKQKDLDKYFAGSVNKGHELFGFMIKERLRSDGIDVNIILV
eukprot:TRINITY_DN23582_c0_g1_i1.p1 TRINITY_DN23582_c0_g1~~TRINITY_DN23582_c0_g1_i1.p1  ORF type:complete len:100 (-),score=21.69 TRINITY_DN23582_c0_g1_i1:10-309(-)